MIVSEIQFSQKEASMKTKLGIIIGLIFCLLLFIFFLFLFCNCLELYPSYDITYDDLISEDLTFLSFEKRSWGKGRYFYDLFFEEYTEPFEISSVAVMRLDKNALNGLKQYDTVHVYYQSLGEFRICELTCGTTVLLKLSDYVEVNQNNQILGMAVSPLAMLATLFFAFLLIRCWISIRRNDLGKPWLETTIDGHIIRVFKPTGILSLEIDGKTADQYRGLGVIARNILLKGKFSSGAKKRYIKVELSSFYIRLYCDKKLVKKVLRF